MSPAIPYPAESAYVKLALERLALSHLKGRSVAYIEGGAPPRPGPRLIDAADAVTVLHESDESAGTEDAEAKVNRQRVMLPHLPYPDGYFGAVVMLGALEEGREPEALIRETRRVLAEAGTLVLGTPDKQAYANDRNLRDPEHRRTLYVPELRELLERNFREVRLYRTGAVAGGLVTDLEEVATNVTVDATDSQIGDYVLAVCGPKAEVETPFLVLDEEATAFEELSEARREAKLLRAEIRQMQYTEVQSFRDALKLERERVSKLGSNLGSQERLVGELEARLEDRERAAKSLLDENEALKARTGALKARNGALRKRLQRIEESRTWRALGLYRRLRAFLRNSSQGH